MIKHSILSFALLGMLLGLNAQNPPVFERPADTTILVGSGQNFLVIPGISDGDEGVEQEIGFTVVSADPAVVEVLGMEYTAGQTMALLQVSEKGILDTVQLSVIASDADGQMSMDIRVVVGAYDNPGINFEVHDIIFWQEAIPLTANPAFSMIAPTGEAPYADIDLAGLDLLVYSDCSGDVCTGTDFFTGFFKGYLKPLVTGDYTFYMRAGDRNCIGLSTDENFDNIRHIIYTGSEQPSAGTSIGNKEYKSDPVLLEAGRTYAIYGTHWNIHTLLGGMSWEGPGIAKQFIPGENLSFVHDVVKPSVPGDFTLLNTGINDLMVSWTAATDDRNLAGYRLYLNGYPVSEDPITETSYQCAGLDAGTAYSIMVTSLDRAGNESLASEILFTRTYESDDQPPLPPTVIEAPVISDLYMQLSWSGASDAETEIRGYKVYVDGQLFNSELIYVEEALITGLDPEQDHLVEIEAVDAGYNVSAKSSGVTFTTTAFDPLDVSISDKKARMKLVMEPLGRSEGIGVNLNYISGQFMNDPDQVRLIREHGSAAIRWGALTANPLNFEDYIGSGKAMTIAKFMNFCNEEDAYTVFTCGVEDGTDWRQDPQTFVNFLEYIAGPAESTYGAKRAAEGFTEPLLDKSKGLVFEFGNEVWGGASHDAQIGSNYGAYGEWCREMARLMRASEYYDSTRIHLTYSGRNPNLADNYGLHESLLEGDKGEVDWLAVSGYMGGNLSYSPEIDPGDTELDYYKNGLTYMSRNLDGLSETMDMVLQVTGSFKPTYFYESNMTTESYYGRLGQAIVQTDYYASAAERGGAIPTIFHLTGGQWKMTVPAQDYKKLPLFHTSQFYNRFCKGNVIAHELETWAGVRNYVGADGPLDPVGAHAYVQDDAFTVLLFSRDFENEFAVQVDLPDDLALIAPEQGMKYVIGGEDFSATEASIDSVQITMSDSLLVKVPPYSMVLLHFGADGSAIDDVDMGAFLDYVSATDIEISITGTTGYTIVGNEKKALKVTVSPEDVWSDAVIWTVDSSETEVYTHKESFGFVVEGSKTCAGNGEVRIRATAWDNPEVYDEVVISISEQGADCNLGMEEEAPEQIALYPNPAGESLILANLPAGGCSVEVLDLGGRKLLSRTVSSTSQELALDSLEPGIYYLRVFSEKETFILSFIRK